ncbi:PREDICTED: apyrase-like [Polistes dominula]|uniref:Apyrase-like n=1 Tax=Polistes dominula TaxID=743375 RepID=A0ABM1JGZ5_POLDO|nr:PREDICTED: apyrase-like [Polistes dominula]
MYTLLLIGILLQTCLAFTGRGLVYPGQTDFFELSIIHLNDFHARFQQTNPDSSICHRGQENDCVGGIARVYTAVNQLKKERPNAIFLNAGDHYQGTLWYNVHRWNVTATFMNMLPHDALTLGNHDFDDKIAGVVPFLKAMKAPVIVTNIDDSEEPSIQGLYKNSTIIERGGKKIGIIGVILSTTNTISRTEKLRFLDEVDSVNEEAQKLKNQGVDIIIALTHCGLNIDRIMAANCPLLDVIVGGHSHTFLYSGKPPFIDLPEDDYPVIVKQENTNRTVLIVQAGAFTKYLGNLTVWFDEQGEVADWEGNPILLDYTIEEDPDILKALVPWQKDVDAMAWKQVGKTKVFLDSKCKGKQCNLGNFITDAMVDAFVDMAENKTYWTYAAISCTNTGGIRASITDYTVDITYGDLMMVQPFENTWDTVEITGSSIKYLLENERIMLWSGLKVIYNMTKNAPNRLVDVKIRCRACEVPRYEDLADDEWYRIVVPSFLYNGGDNIKIFKEMGRNHKVGSYDIDLFEKYVQKMSPIIAETDNRVNFLYVHDEHDVYIS